MNKRSRYKNREGGFTLIEVLVAMAVMSTAIASALIMMSQHVRTASDIEQRLIAGIVAENILIEGLTDQGQLEVASTKGQTSMGGREWVWTQVIAEAGFPGLYQVRVEVRLEDSAQILRSVEAFREATP